MAHTFGRLVVERPLVLFDLEATGKYPERDRIVEMALVKLYTFRQIAPMLAHGLNGSDLAGYNARRYDVPMLVAAEFARVQLQFSLDGRRVIDPQVIFHKKEPRDLEAAVRFFCEGASHDGKHRTEADVEATFKILLAELERYPDLPATVEELHA